MNYDLIKEINILLKIKNIVINSINNDKIYITLNINDLLYLYNFNDILTSNNCDKIILERLIYTEKSSNYNPFDILLDFVEIYNEILKQNEAFKYIKIIEIYDMLYPLLLSYTTNSEYNFNEEFKDKRII